VSELNPPDLDPMECDEELLAHLAQQAKIMEGRWFYEMTPEDARAAYAKLSSWHRGDPATKRPVGEIVDEVIHYGGEPMRVRVYKPAKTGKLPVVVYFHGGGWVFGNIDSYDEMARLICAECDVVVVNVDYLLAPEHRFPEPLLSCVESVAWTKQNIDAFGGDPDAVLVMGDSAGGNLSAATALECAHRNIELAGQVVLYGPLVHMDSASKAGVSEWSERDQRFGPTFDSTAWYWGHYVGDAERGADPRASVLLETDMASAPPALIAAGMLDTFCQECVAYGRALADNGVKVQVSEYPRLTHGYTSHGYMPPNNRSQLAYTASMETLANVRTLAYS